VGSVGHGQRVAGVLLIGDAPDRRGLAKKANSADGLGKGASGRGQRRTGKTSLAGMRADCPTR
jgi:hypothetical protein